MKRKLVTSFFIGLLWSISSFSMDFRPYNSTFSLSVHKGRGDIFVCSSVAIDPYTLLTAAHCLDGAYKISVNVNNEEREAYQWNVHPEYDKEESNFHADIGIISLYKKLPQNLNYPPIMIPSKTLPLVRIGFGGREGSNNRTYINGIKVLNRMENTLVLKDSLGVPGDSGGPLFQYFNGVLTLVAIHSTIEGQKSFAPIIDTLL
ncbi:MAG: trypsin-like serine protease [Halobacteriovoraceae bacterium]|nr:trypsin-like serine protease [Halobacteriovoraceae bacterium]